MIHKPKTVTYTGALWAALCVCGMVIRDPSREAASRRLEGHVGTANARAALDREEGACPG